MNRYCWSQQNSSSDISSQPCNTDGQIYTLTVLNGNEPWLQQQHQQEPNIIQRKICDTPEDTPTPALDFDSLLNTFPGYIKTEYTYDDSGFSTDNKDDIILSSSQLQTPLPSLQPPQQQPQQQHPSIQQQISVTNSTNLNNITAAFHNNNNNDWQMADHNITTVDVSAARLTRLHQRTHLTFRYLSILHRRRRNRCYVAHSKVKVTQKACKIVSPSFHP